MLSSRPTAHLRPALRLALVLVALVCAGAARGADCPEKIFGAWDIENTRGVPEGNILNVSRDGDKIVGIYSGSIVQWRLEGDYANGTWMGTFHTEQVGSTFTLNGTFQYAYHPGALPGRDELEGQWLDRGQTTNQYLGRPHADPDCPSTTTTTLPSCSGPEGTRAPQCHGNVPQVTSLVVPPVAQENKPFPVAVGFSDPGGAVDSVSVEEESLIPGHWNGVGGASFAPIKDQGVVTLAVTCTANGIPGKNVNFRLRAIAGDVEHQSSEPSTPEGFKCVAKGLVIKMVAAAAESVATAAMTLAALDAARPGGDPKKAPAKVAALVLALKLYKAAIELYNSDPPDANFTVIAQPVTPFFTRIQADDGTTQDLADALNALLDNYVEAAGLVEALRVSYERAQGAGEGGSVEWYTMQMEAAHQHAARWTDALREHVPRATTLQGAWQADGLPEIAVTAADVRTLQDEVRANGLPPSVRTLLEQAGAVGDLAPLADTMLNADPDKVAAASFPAILTDPTMMAGVDEAVGELDRVVSAFAEVPCGGSCNDGDPCTLDLCSGHECQHQTLHGGEAVCSSCQGGILSPACVGQPLPASVGKRLTQVCSLRAQLAGSQAKVAKRIAKQAAKNVRAAGALVKKAAKKRQHGVARECATVMKDILRGPL